MIGNIFNRFRKLPKSLIIIMLLALAGGGYFFQKNFLAGKATGNAEYQTTKAVKETLVSSVSASGQVLTVNIMSANTLASGTVKTVFVKDGDVVRKGDKILEINLDFQGQQKNAAAWASYLSAKNSLESSRISLYALQADLFSKWEDYRDLAENSTYTNDDGSPDTENRTLPEFIISNNNWLSSEAKYKQQQAVIAQSQAALNSSWMSYSLTSPVITAPTDGTITSLMYTEGMTIGSLDTGNSSSNEKVATIKTEGMPVVSVNLSEIDVSKVEIGQKVTLTVDSIAGKTFTGEVVGVDRIGQTSSGVTQYPAIIRLDTAPKELLPGMAVTANIVTASRENALTVPSAAVSTLEDGQAVVRVMVNGREQSVPVTTGLASDTKIEITEGISEGDTVITGSQTLNTTQSGGQSPFSGNQGMNIIRMAR